MSFSRMDWGKILRPTHKSKQHKDIQNLHIHLSLYQQNLNNGRFWLKFIYEKKKSIILSPEELSKFSLLQNDSYKKVIMHILQVFESKPNKAGGRRRGWKVNYIINYRNIFIRALVLKNWVNFKPEKTTSVCYLLPSFISFLNILTTNTAYIKTTSLFIRIVFFKVNLGMLMKLLVLITTLTWKFKQIDLALY